MGINQFLPIANDPLAVITPQVNWAGSSKQVLGFPPGVVSQEDMNKALRQCSVFSAAIAQAMADTLGVDVLDNGDFTSLVNQVKTFMRVLDAKRGGTQALASAARLWVWRRDTTPVYSSPKVPLSFVIRDTGFVGGALVYSGPVVLFGGYDGYVYCLNATTGVELWRTQVGGGIYGRVMPFDIDGDGLLEIVAADQAGRIFILRCNGDVQYSGETTRALNSAYVRDGGRSQSGDAFLPLVATGGGANYIELTGATWAAKAFMRTTPLSGPIHDEVEILDAGGTVVTDTKRILDVTIAGTPRITVASNFAVAPSAGTKFRIKPDHASDYFFMHAGTINVEGGVPYLYQTGFDHHLVKFNLATRAVVWQRALGGDTELFPAVLDVDGDTNLEVVTISYGGVLTEVGMQNAYVTCWDAATGAFKWGRQTYTGSVSSMAVEQIDGTSAWSVLVGQQNGMLLKLRGTDGALLDEIGTFSDYSWEGIDGVPVKLPMEGGTHDVFLGSDAGYLTRLANNLNVKWQQRMDCVFNSSPVLADINGDGQVEIIIADMSGAVYILNLEGGVLGAIFVHGGVESTPIVIDYDGDGRLEIIIPTLLGYVECWRFTES